MRIQEKLRDMHVGGRGYTAGGGFDGGESVFVCLKGGEVTMSRCHPAAQSPEKLQLELGPPAWELSLPAWP